MASLSFVADPEDEGQTLAAALRRRLPGSPSWSDIRRIVQTGKVTVGEARELNPAARLAAGQTVRMDPRARRTRTRPAGAPSVRIVHEDADLVVIEKPPGISSVPFERKETGTAMDLVREAWRADGRKHVTAQPLLIVHRIDKDTSGLLVYAKNKAAERGLAAQFRLHTVERTYLCVVFGTIESRRIESRLVRDRGDGLRGSTRHPKHAGKTAITHVEALRVLGGGVATFCRVRLETGKTHQIRIHLSEVGHPLLGERVYVRDLLRRGGALPPAPRLLLHAATLGFVHPKTGERIRLESPLSAEFEAALRALERR